MADLVNVVGFTLEIYPFKHEMSNARLTKTIYLSDWHYLLKTGTRLTDIQWYFDNFGPFVWDVRNVAERVPGLFNVFKTQNARGATKLMFELRPHVSFFDKLDELERSSIQSVVDSTKDMYWDEFIKLVYSTYPVINGEKYTQIDLERCARDYKKEYA